MLPMTHKMYRDMDWLREQVTAGIEGYLEQNREQLAQSRPAVVVALRPPEGSQSAVFQESLNGTFRRSSKPYAMDPAGR